MATGYYVTLTDEDGNSETITPGDLITLDAPVEDSVINEWSVTVAYDEGFDQYRYGDAIIEFEDPSGTREIERRGPVDVISHDDGAGETTIRGRGELSKLTEHGPTLPFIAKGVAWKEVKRLWQNIPDWSATVTQPTPENENLGRTIQSLSTATEWSDVFDPVSELPYHINNDTLTLYQTSFTADTADQDTSNCFVRTSSFGASDASDGQYAALLSDGQSLSYTFSTDYTIPGDAFALYIRWGLESGATDNHSSPFEGPVTATLSGGSLSEDYDLGTYGTVRDGFEGLFRWTDGNDGSGEDMPDLEPGGYTVTFELVEGFNSTATSDPGFKIDVVAPLDGRFEYEFPDSLTAGYLDGPGLYGVGLDAAPVPAPAASDLNIITGTLSVTPVNASAVDRLQLRPGNDDETWRPIDPTAGTSVSVDFKQSTGKIQGRVELNARRGLSAQSSTPRLRYEPEALTDWAITVDENDLQFFSGTEYTGSWFKIAQEVHADANMLFRGIPDSEQMAESFGRGGVSDSADWTRTGFTKEFDTTDFANRVIAVGEGKDRPSLEIRATNSPIEEGETLTVKATIQRNDPPRVVVDDDTSISNVGVHTAFITVNSTSESEVRNKADAELRRRLALDERTGSVEIVPRRLKPGYEYQVDAFGTTAVLRRQNFQDVGSATSTLEFKIEDDIATQISGVRGETRD